MRTDEYESIDRAAVEYVITAVRNDTRFYLTDDSVYTDIPRRAHRFRSWQEADGIAHSEEKRNAFGWTAARIVCRRTLLIGDYSETLATER